jgi:hypothetical protein
MEKMKPHLIHIFLEGGVIHGVQSPQGVNVKVYDYDTEGVERNRIKQDVLGDRCVITEFAGQEDYGNVQEVVESLQALIDTANLVVARWSQGDLAGAVNELEHVAANAREELHTFLHPKKKRYRYSDGNTYTDNLTLKQAHRFRRLQNGGTITAMATARGEGKN